jgi:hypothetical protein
LTTPAAHSRAGARGDADPGFADPADCLRARDVFATAGYTEAGLREVLATEELFWTGPGQLPPGLRRTRTGTPLDTLIRLFFLGVPVALDAARRAVAPMDLATWARANLLVESAGEIAPLVKAVPHRGLLLLADMPAKIRSGGGGSDFVLGVSKSSVLMAHTVVPRPAARTLDLGTGCGILALLASPHSGQVYATDKNPRAVAFAELNVRLNGIGNVECMTGDLFEPVAGQRFDLVVCNPPYVIAPRARYLFCDSGLRGDEFCRQLARLAAGALAEGGYCQIMSNWAHRSDQSWEEPLASWFGDLGCDVLVWGAETQDASSYALNWIEQTEVNHRDRLSQLYDEWMDYFEREGIEAITYGLVSMRRRAGANWVRFVKVPRGSAAPDGEHVLRRFQMQDFLESAADDRALLDGRFQLAPEVRIEQHYAAKDAGFAAMKTRLHLARDPEFYTMEADGTVARFVLSYSAPRLLRDVLDEMAASMGIAPAEVVPGGLAVARRLIENGYLRPIPASS